MRSKDRNAAKGRRYTAAEKQEIIAFVEKVNAEKGRGGQTVAAKKFKISQVTISAWVRSGAGSGNGARRGGLVGTGSISEKLAKLQELHDQIVRIERELVKFRGEFNSIKASI